jgi:hypothetical protein
LIEGKQIVPANAGILREYGRRHAVYNVHSRLAERRAKRVCEQRPGVDLDTLRHILAEMQADTSERGFEAEKTYHNAARIKARKVLTQISNTPPLSEKDFLKLYESLVGDLWHSGGLQRGKNLVAAMLAQSKMLCNRSGLLKI